MDEARFRQLVKRFIKEDYTEAQAQCLAYKDMGLPIPEKIEKKVRDEEMTLDMIGNHLPLKVKKKTNPIKKQSLASGDIRVFRTEDDKFVIVKKEKGCYGVYPEGNQFKRVGTPNKKAALEKAVEILSRKNNPAKYHGTIQEIGDDIKKQIIDMYQSGDTIIRIARVVHLNIPLVKEVLAEAKVPVRKGGYKKEIKSNPRKAKTSFASLVKEYSKVKRKSNPGFDAVAFMNSAIKNLPKMWVKLRQYKFGSPEFNDLVKIIMWNQGVFLDWVSNSYVTIFMISSLYDSFGVVEKDPEKYFKMAIHLTLFDRARADSIVEKLSPKSYGAKAIDFFDKSKVDRKLYFNYMKEREDEFADDFTREDSKLKLVDFVNFLRYFSSERYSEKHEVLTRELTMKILKRKADEEVLPEEIDKVKSMVEEIHQKAMEVIARSKLFLQGYVEVIEKLRKKDGQN